MNSTQLELKGVQLPTFLRGCAVDGQGFYYLSYYNYELNKIIHKFSKEGVKVNSFGEPFDTNNPSGFSAFYVKHSNAPGVLANLDESLFFSQANPYEIRKYSLDGKLKIKVVRKNSFMAPQKMEMTQGRFTIKVPVNSTTIGVWQNMLINCVGFPPPHTNHNKKTVIDFFSMEGQLLTSLTLEERVFFSYIDHRGKVYGVKFDDNLEESIVKYALKVRQE